LLREKNEERKTRTKSLNHTAFSKNRKKSLYTKSKEYPVNENIGLILFIVKPF
jgi:hypothetical protein